MARKLGMMVGWSCDGYPTLKGRDRHGHETRNRAFRSSMSRFPCFLSNHGHSTVSVTHKFEYLCRSLKTAYILSKQEFYLQSTVSLWEYESIYCHNLVKLPSLLLTSIFIPSWEQNLLPHYSANMGNQDNKPHNHNANRHRACNPSNG